MWWRSPHNPTAYDDDLEDQPAQGWFYQWVLGAALPAALVAFGFEFLLTRTATLGGRYPLTLHGMNAIAIGIATISLAPFLHFHYFWGNVYNQAWWAVLGKIIGATGFIAGLAIAIVRLGIFGFA